jgi:hypothetical protein
MQERSSAREPSVQDKVDLPIAITIAVMILTHPVGSLNIV